MHDYSFHLSETCAAVAEDDVAITAEEEDRQNAMEVELVQAPQDGSADTIVKLVLAPSYITYHAATVQRLVDFFHTEQVYHSALSALGSLALTLYMVQDVICGIQFYFM